MTDQSITITFQPDGAAADQPDLWAKLEQEYIPVASQSAGLSDLYQMLALVMAGQDAYQYAWDACPYATLIIGDESDTVAVKLDFYVWASDLSLAYSLSADIGEISPGVVVKLERSFDVIVDGTDTIDLGFLFSGTLIPEMPCFDDMGAVVPLPDIEIDGSVLRLSRPVTTVLRATGIATGYQHQVVMYLVKALADADQDNPVIDKTGYKIENLENTITCKWIDEAGKGQQDDLDLEIPSCVEDLLADCSGGDLPGSFGEITRPEKQPVLYYSTCNGKPIELRYE